MAHNLDKEDSIIKENLEECGFDDLKDELKDVVKALKGENDG